MNPGVVVLCGLLLAQAGASTSATTGRITGRVVADDGGAPIGGARVMLFPAMRPTGPPAQGGMWRPRQTQTDEDGRFVFESVDAGSYRVDVQKTGFAPIGRADTGPTAEVAAGRTSELALRLQKGGVIAGKLLDAKGEPLPDIRVMAMHRAERPARMAAQPAAGPMFLVPAPGNVQLQTNDLGEFRIAGLAPGDYYVAAMPGGGGPMFGGAGATPVATGKANTTTFYPGTTDQAAAQPVKVGAGETIYNIVFTMQSAPGFRVSGRVIDETGAPIAGAMVMLMPARPGGFVAPPGHAATGDDGRFAFTDVASAAYRINASIPIQMGRGATTASGGTIVGGGSFTTWSSVGAARAVPASAGDGTEVTVNDGDVTGVSVVIRRPQQ